MTLRPFDKLATETLDNIAVLRSEVDAKSPLLAHVEALLHSTVMAILQRHPRNLNGAYNVAASWRAELPAR